MSRAVVIPDVLYTRLEGAAHARGFSSIEQLLETWQLDEESPRQRPAVVARIDALRESLFAKYGARPDSAEDVRADRAR